MSELKLRLGTAEKEFVASQGLDAETQAIINCLPVPLSSSVICAFISAGFISKQTPHVFWKDGPWLFRLR